jgi:hypothetical protein
VTSWSYDGVSPLASRAEQVTSAITRSIEIAADVNCRDPMATLHCLHHPGTPHSVPTG